MNASGEPRMDLEKLRELEASLALYARALEVEHPILRGPAHGPNGAERRNPFSDCHECALLNDFTNGRLPVAAPSSDAASQPETLDAAWKEAEAALPVGDAWDGETLGLGGWHCGNNDGAGCDGDYSAIVRGANDENLVEGRGRTPAAALRNLATRLKEGKE